MFTSSRKPSRPSDSFSSRYGTTKSVKMKNTSFREKSVQAGLERSQSFKPRKEDTPLATGRYVSSHPHLQDIADMTSALTSPIITICVGPEQRLFAGHEHILSRSPYFQAACKGQFLGSQTRRIDIPDEQPEILSVVLEYLYRGDYYPRLVHNKRKDTWELEEGASAESTVYHQGNKTTLLKDTII